MTARVKNMKNVMVPLYALFEAMSDGVLITDEDGIRTYANTVLNDFVGEDAREPASSAEPPPWIPEDQVTRYLGYIEDAANGELSSPTIALEWSLLDRHDQSVPVVVKLLPMRSLPGAPAAILWIIQPSGPLTHGSVREQLLEDGLRRIGVELDRLGLGRGLADASDAVLSFDGIDRLSPRELDVVRLLLEGHRVVSIAAELGVSEHTIRNHLKSIFRKLGIHSQAELVRHARTDAII